VKVKLHLHESFVKTVILKIVNLCFCDICKLCLSAFRTRGVPGPTSKLSPRAPAQMGRRETEREGEKKPEGDRRKRGNSWPSCLSRAQVGCACSRGLQASTREGASGLRECRPVLPRAANPL
jgi:hypothetical protein